MRICLFILAMVCLTAGQTFSQVAPYHSWYLRAEKLFNLDNPRPADDSIAASLYIKTFPAALADGNGELALQSLIKTGTIRQTYGRYEEACSMYRKSLELNNSYFRDTPLLYYASLYMGTAFYQQGTTDSARYYFESASALTNASPNSAAFPEQERLYNSLGAIYYEIANYQQAINYFEKAKQFIGSSADDREAMVTLQSNIANCYVQLNRNDVAIKILRSLLPQKYIQRALLHNTGHAYFKANQYDSARYFFNRVKHEEDWITVRMMNDVGNILISTGDDSGAVRSLDEALRICNVISKDARSKDRAFNFLSRAKLADRQRKKEDAIRWCNRSIEELYVNYDAAAAAAVAADETRCVSPIILLEVLKYKTTLLDRYYKTGYEVGYLKERFATALKAIHVASYIRRWLDNDEAKIFFQEDESSIYHSAMDAAFELWHKGNGYVTPEQVIGIVVEYKGNVLYENIRQATSKAKSNLPLQVRAREKSLRESLSYYTVQLGNAATPAEAADLRKKIIDVQVELSRLRKQFEDHKAYDFLKDDPKSDYYNQLTAFIDNKTALLSYLVTGENIYGIAITRKGFDIEKIDVDDAFRKAYTTFSAEIYEHSEGRRYAGQAAGKMLYDKLISPFNQLLETKAKWVIMPDGFLNYVPFDALTRGEDNRDYLVYHHAISYHYSFPLLMNHRQQKVARISDKILFFAPFTDVAVQTAALPMLPFSVSEVPSDGMNRFIGSQAAKSTFLNVAGKGNIIHLATHAFSGRAENKEARICFYPSAKENDGNNLYLNEIYAMDLDNADLVVLSACETAGGAAASGEGVLSLSRAFMYAGSKGIISTLWKTEDRLSAKLMQYFYEGLKAGYGNEEALQRAKVKILKDEDISDKYKTPNYWGNFIYTGSISETKGDGVRTEVVVSIFICTLILIAVRRMLKRKSYSAIPE